MLAFTIAVWIIAVLLWLELLRRIRREDLLLKTLWRREYAGLALVLALFAPIYWRLFSRHMLWPGAGGVYSGGGAYYDLPLHLAVSTSFLYGGNFPPIYTPLPPEPLLYPFLPDFMTALLAALGMNFRWALLSTSIPLALATTGLFYLLAQRILSCAVAPAVHASDASHRSPWGHVALVPAAAVLATILFLLDGGLGFLYFFEDWRTSKQGFLEFWSHLATNYGNMNVKQIHWTNVISDAFLPQRTFLFGFPVAMMAFSLFAVVWHGGWEGKGNGRWDGWNILLPAGVLVGLLPLFHTHTYIAVGLVSGFLFLLRPRVAWVAFWLPALLLAAPHILSLTGHVGSMGFMHIQLNWRGGSSGNWLLYWLRNLGTPLLMIGPAWVAAPREWRTFYLAFVGLMAFSLVVIVSPNPYDNIKLMYYWYAASSILIAAWLVRLAHVHRQRLLASLLALSAIASALLALQYEDVNRKLVFSHEEMEAARFVRENTAPAALFLAAPANHQPVLSLAGRPVLRGPTAWLWSHGYDFIQREADVRAIYTGSPEAPELLSYYRVDFVSLGPRERETFRADQAFFDERFPVFYHRGQLTIYDTRPPELRIGAAVEGEYWAKLRAPYAPREFASRVGKDPAQLLVEFPRAAYAVYRYYQVARGGWPEYREFMEDMRALGRGVYVGASGWERVLEENKLALTDAWPTREEFRRSFEEVGAGEFVDALYTNAGLTPGASERAAHVRALDGGVETRASILRRVAEDPRLRRREHSSAFVLIHYFGYLRRNPDDPPDNDLTGFNFWLNELNSTGDYRSLSRVFIESGEYKDQSAVGSGQ
ncbi:MAG: hypothetical protein H7Z16_04190 [Pyrinomonadaceae bacterium]|nr:hypothetical protein [Pyrinomonadaceae bacterium]